MANERNHQLRMGRTMPHTSADGAEHPESFWCLSFAAFDVDASVSNMRFVGFHSVTAYDAGADPIAGAQKLYQIMPDKWEQSVFVPLPAPEEPFAVNFLLQTWNVALNTLEGPEPQEGEEDTRTSFFVDSVPVPPTAPQA